MKRILLLTLIIFTGFQSFAQKKSKGISFSLQVGSENETEKPKLVVGIVVDQMRYDYMYRFWDDFENDGFKKLIQTGYRIFRN